MDVATSAFRTPGGRQVTILDAPGHQDFVPRMIAGATQVLLLNPTVYLVAVARGGHKFVEGMQSVLRQHESSRVESSLTQIRS